jgi:enamine deaminase RidA (YjgF/YER057c/UK114 family)
MSKTVYPISGPMADTGLYSGKVAFSRGVKISGGGELCFLSGQLAVDEHRTIVGKGDMGAQARQVLRNLQAVLKDMGATFQDVCKVTVFVKDITQFRAIHDARLEFFHPDHLPASTMVEVSAFVNPDALIEIEMIAVLPARGGSASARATGAQATGAQATGAQATGAQATRAAAKKPARRVASRAKGNAKRRR